MLVGVYVNSRERGTMTLQLLSGEYWIPWNEFLAVAGVPSAFEQDGIATIATSIGDIRFDTRQLRLFDGQRHVSFRMLEEQFRVFPSFNQPLFAVMIQLPWSPALPKTVRGDALKPDVTAPDASVAFVHSGFQFSSESGQPDTQRYELMSGGRAAGGVWDMKLEGDKTVNQLQPVQYHWTSLAANSAFRLGTGITESATLLGSIPFTGAQFAVSNRPILTFFDQSFSSAQDSFMSFNGDQRRTIEGDGPPAGIAELRFDDKIVARQRIRLDGRFSFPDIQMGSGARKIEVYLYVRSLLDKPDTVLNYTQSISSRALEAGQLLLSGGAGVSGNPLLDDQAGTTFSDLVSFGRLRYGVNRWLTAETALQHSDLFGCNEGMAGVVLSIGSSWNAGAYAALSNERYGTELSIERQGKRSSLFLTSTSYQKGCRSDNQPTTSHQFLYYSLRPRQNINLSLMGQRDQSDDNDDTNDNDYLRPGLSLFFGSGIGFSITPVFDQQKSYQYELSWSRQAVQWHMSYYDNIVDMSASADVSDRVRVRLAHRHDHSSNIDQTSAYFDWYTTPQRRALLQLVGTYADAEQGLSLSYHRPVNAGVELSIGYRYSMLNALQLDTSDLNISNEPKIKHALNLSLSLDFGWSGKRFQPVNHSTLSPTRGGIAGSVAFEDKVRPQSSSLEKVGILINGRNVAQDQERGSFFAGNLKPGLYRVTLDPADLPVELSADSKGKIVEVKSGAITNVSIPVYAEYGVAGQVTDPDGNGLADREVFVRKLGEALPVSAGFTNQFGYYRLDGLRNGVYSISSELLIDGRKTMIERTVSIQDNYVFDVNLQSPK